MSLQTTMALAYARGAEDAWRRHRRYCPLGCGYRKPCEEGAALRDTARERRAEARRQAELDKLPVPGQGTLFELAGDSPAGER
jgi:hypothetical protein